MQKNKMLPCGKHGGGTRLDSGSSRIAGSSFGVFLGARLLRSTRKNLPQSLELGNTHRFPNSYSLILGILDPSICTPRASMRFPASVVSSVSDDPGGDGPIRPTLQKTTNATKGVRSFDNNIEDRNSRLSLQVPSPFFCPYISVVSPLSLPRHRNAGELQDRF